MKGWEGAGRCWSIPFLPSSGKHPLFNRNKERGIGKNHPCVGPAAWSGSGSVIRVFCGLIRKSCQIPEEKKILKSYPREDRGQILPCKNRLWLWAQQADLPGKQPRCCVCLSAFGVEPAGWPLGGTCGLAEGPTFAG